MKVLVTGATGFIGGRFVSRMVRKEFDVVCTVRKTSNTSSLEKMGAPLRVCDITDAGEVDEALRDEMPDIVCHSAALVRSDDPQDLYSANVTGTRNILKACFERGIKRLVYVSTIAVINGNDELPLNDGMPYKANCSYGESKLEAEKIVVEYRKKGLNCAIIRPCMIYGEDEPHLLNKLFSLAEKYPIMVPDNRDAEKKLHLGYVENVAQVMELAMFSDKALDGTFIIADEDILTYRQFLEILSQELGKGKPRMIPEWLIKLLLVIPAIRKKYESMFKDRIFDISRAVDLLEYKQVMSAEEALRRTVRAWRIQNAKCKMQNSKIR